jgi:hypothetical protein
VNEADCEANLHGGLGSLIEQLLGLRNARWVIVHVVVVRSSPGKRVPLGRNLVAPLYAVPRSTGDIHVECRHR